MRDPAAAAGMSDPVRNPSFRRRWQEPQFNEQRTTTTLPTKSDVLGPIGLALLEAWQREGAGRSKP